MRETPGGCRMVPSTDVQLGFQCGWRPLTREAAGKLNACDDSITAATELWVGGRAGIWDSGRAALRGRSCGRVRGSRRTCRRPRARSFRVWGACPRIGHNRRSIRRCLGHLPGARMRAFDLRSPIVFPGGRGRRWRRPYPPTEGPRIRLPWRATLLGCCAGWTRRAKSPSRWAPCRARPELRSWPLVLGHAPAHWR